MKTNLDSFFKTDEKLSEDGVEFFIGRTTFKLRHFSQTNPRVRAAFAKHYKPVARQVDLGTLDPKEDLVIRIKIFIDVSLIGWSGLEDENGEEIEFSKEAALELFKRLPDLFTALWDHANDFKNYREDLGNS